MNLDINIRRNVEEYAKELKERFDLSYYECFDLALKAEQNQILRAAFVILNDDSKPSALESIAIHLGENSL